MFKRIEGHDVLFTTKGPGLGVNATQMKLVEDMIVWGKKTKAFAETAEKFGLKGEEPILTRNQLKLAHKDLRDHVVSPYFISKNLACKVPTTKSERAADPETLYKRGLYNLSAIKQAPASSKKAAAGEAPETRATKKVAAKKVATKKTTRHKDKEVEAQPEMAPHNQPSRTGRAKYSP